MNSRWTSRGARTTRRQTLAALAALTAGGAVGIAGVTGIAGCGAGRSRGTAAEPARASEPGAAEPFTSTVGDKRALLLQIMAHPDDDLYFMNPDAEHVLRSGTPVVCVYVTAGEARGSTIRRARRSRAPTRRRTPPPATRGCGRRTRR
ncbi:hypothetical protein SVIO_062960 [Streptomyces violaceusniger]|uniref:Uncharacterized protein n=1 Tax=Streptomyces violaceusniger TaxID=68280 RepID=A0A4D4LC64_STRVO|nr:hypothetical protein SVIO_062960 [Streptomyces violaceusniger]